MSSLVIFRNELLLCRPDYNLEGNRTNLYRNHILGKQGRSAGALSLSSQEMGWLHVRRSCVIGGKITPIGSPGHKSVGRKHESEEFKRSTA